MITGQKGCNKPCAACRIDRIPITDSRPYDDNKRVFRPIERENPGRVSFTKPDELW